ncbi:MAG: hypothetical protein IPK26_26465 [Planctomycetes bacterium]|nr:hypothetical protein [Planctomycetota bacterium]
MHAHLSVCLLTAPMLAQIQGGHALVVTNLPGQNPRCELLDVDPAGGTIARIGRFVSDNLPARAVAIDPVQGDALLALDSGSGTRIVRIALTGGRAGAELPLGTIPGVVSDLTVGLECRVYCTTGGTGGAVFELPRMGGSPRVLAAAPFATAIGNPGIESGMLLIGISGDPNGDPRPAYGAIDLWTGQFGMHRLPGLPSLAVTGLGVRPFGNDVLTDGSRVWHVLLPTTTLGYQVPALPADGIRALERDDQQRLLAIGGNGHPFLGFLLDAPSLSQNWTTLAGPLPGDPIDFAIQSTDWWGATFGGTCRHSGPPGPTLTGAGLSRLGNPNYWLAVQNAASMTLAIFVAGTSDRQALGVQLPLPAPGGCPLLVAPDIALLHVTDNLGQARQTVPLPGVATLQGLVVFTQWLIVPPDLRVATTPAAGLHLRF